MGCVFDNRKNKQDQYKGRDGIKKICKDLKDNTRKIINYEKKEMTPLKNKKHESYIKMFNYMLNNI